jgi:hypothetical protein
MIVPEDGSRLDLRVERYRNIRDKITCGREQWIEGTLELAVFMREARIDYPDHTVFSRWLERNELKKISKDERTALLWMADNQAEARELLTRTTFKSWDTIYRRRPNRALRVSPKGAIRGKLSGSASLKRAKRIPDVMREDNPPGERFPWIDRQRVHVQPPERKVPVLKVLTPEQIDPDFKGTSIEFATKHGHVNLHTKDQIEHHKRQETLSAWLGAMADHQRTARALLMAAAALDPTALQEWRRKPGKAERLQVWCKDIQLASDGLDLVAKIEVAS